MFTIEHYLQDGKRLAEKGSAAEITAALLRARADGIGRTPDDDEDTEAAELRYQADALIVNRTAPFSI
jgi:hypothetical protein